jgi:hypothetical protein
MDFLMVRVEQERAGGADRALRLLRVRVEVELLLLIVVLRRAR